MPNKSVAAPDHCAKSTRRAAEQRRGRDGSKKEIQGNDDGTKTVTDAIMIHMFSCLCLWKDAPEHEQVGFYDHIPVQRASLCVC